MGGASSPPLRRSSAEAELASSSDELGADYDESIIRCNRPSFGRAPASGCGLKDCSCSASCSSVITNLSRASCRSLQDRRSSRDQDRRSSRDVIAEKGPLGIFWDIENCGIPADVSAEDVAGAIRTSLQLHPATEGTHITMFSAYGDFNQFPRKLREGCQRTGISLLDVPNGKKDAADKAILADLFLFAIDNPAPASILLISGDVDFSASLHKLGQRGFLILLAVPVHVGVSSALLSAGRFVWDWPSLARGQGLVPSKAVGKDAPAPSPPGRALASRLLPAGHALFSTSFPEPSTLAGSFGASQSGLVPSLLIGQPPAASMAQESQGKGSCPKPCSADSEPSSGDEASGGGPGGSFSRDDGTGGQRTRARGPSSRAAVPCARLASPLGPLAGGSLGRAASWVAPGDVQGLQDQLGRLLQAHGGRLELVRVPAEYQRSVGRPLFLAEYGAAKLAHLVLRMKGGLHIEGHGAHKQLCLGRAPPRGGGGEEGTSTQTAERGEAAEEGAAALTRLRGAVLEEGGKGGAGVHQGAAAKERRKGAGRAEKEKGVGQAEQVDAGGLDLGGRQSLARKAEGAEENLGGKRAGVGSGEVDSSEDERPKLEGEMGMDGGGEAHRVEETTDSEDGAGLDVWLPVEALREEGGAPTAAAWGARSRLDMPGGPPEAGGLASTLVAEDDREEEEVVVWEGWSREEEDFSLPSKDAEEDADWPWADLGNGPRVTPGDRLNEGKRESGGRDAVGAVVEEGGADLLAAARRGSQQEGRSRGDDWQGATLDAGWRLKEGGAGEIGGGTGDLEESREEGLQRRRQLFWAKLRQGLAGAAAAERPGGGERRRTGSDGKRRGEGSLGREEGEQASERKMTEKLVVDEDRANTEGGKSLGLSGAVTEARDWEGAQGLSAFSEAQARSPQPQRQQQEEGGGGLRSLPGMPGTGDGDCFGERGQEPSAGGRREGVGLESEADEGEVAAVKRGRLWAPVCPGKRGGGGWGGGQEGEGEAQGGRAAAHLQQQPPEGRPPEGSQRSPRWALAALPAGEALPWRWPSGCRQLSPARGSAIEGAGAAETGPLGQPRRRAVPCRAAEAAQRPSRPGPEQQTTSDWGGGPSPQDLFPSRGKIDPQSDSSVNLPAEAWDSFNPSRGPGLCASWQQAASVLEWSPQLACTKIAPALPPEVAGACPGAAARCQGGGGIAPPSWPGPEAAAAGRARPPSWAAVREEVEELLVSHGGGLACSALLPAFRGRYGRDLATLGRQQVGEVIGSVAKVTRLPGSTQLYLVLAVGRQRGKEAPCEQ